MKGFLEIKDADDEAAIDELLDLGNLNYIDMGDVLHTFRAWPGPFFWVPYGLLWLAVIYRALTASSFDDGVLEFASFGFNLVLWGGVLLTAYGMERHRVCEHGLVLGFRRESEYVIPWATVDPGRVRVARRMGLWSSSGFSADVAAASGGGVRVGRDRGERVGCRDPGRWNVLDPNPVLSPFAWWSLGTRRPDALLRAMEDAMVADGYPAEGMAARARAQEFTVTWKPTVESPVPPRLGTDPVIGVDGPLVD